MARSANGRPNALLTDGRTSRAYLVYIYAVVDTSTEIPGGTGNFIFFTDPFATTSVDGRPATSIENGIVVFSGSGPSGQEGMYAAAVGGSITTIADTNTSLPDGTGNFRLFGTPSLSQGNVGQRLDGHGQLSCDRKDRMMIW